MPSAPPLPRSLLILFLSLPFSLSLLELGRGDGGREGEDGEDEQAAVGHLAVERPSPAS